ncbi:MAG: hypothetical protein KC766_32435 [Myxococcales bacterium]|nr:hypothetical protein [Myxococcales bacterium]MCB1286982.1 hypothetical protein [Mycobacterium sp.]
MSRGFGAVQRDILAKLGASPNTYEVTRWLSADEIREHLRETSWTRLPDEEIIRSRWRFPWAKVTARYTLLTEVCGADASPSRVESYRRAAHKLAAAGLVETALVSHERVRSDGVAYRNELAIRLTEEGCAEAAGR